MKSRPPRGRRGSVRDEGRAGLRGPTGEWNSWRSHACNPKNTQSPDTLSTVGISSAKRSTNTRPLVLLSASSQWVWAHNHTHSSTKKRSISHNHRHTCTQKHNHWGQSQIHISIQASLHIIRLTHTHRKRKTMVTPTHTKLNHHSEIGLFLWMRKSPIISTATWFQLQHLVAGHTLEWLLEWDRL